MFHTSVRESQDRQNSKHLSHVSYDRKLFSFSDCAFITYFYKENIDEARKDERALLQVTLYNTSILLTKIASRGYIVRGGISYGDAFVDHDECFGPAVEEAYLLESKFANYPRVLLSETAGRLQYDFETEIQSSPKVLQFKTMIKNGVAQIVNCDDKQFYLNIFYHLEMEGELNYDGEIITLREIKSVIIKKVDADLSRHKGNAKIKEKLLWLKAYVSNLECGLKEWQRTFSHSL